MLHTLMLHRVRINLGRGEKKKEEKKKNLTLLSKQSTGGGVDLNSKRVLQLVS